MTTNREREKSIRDLHEQYGIDIAGMVKAAFELGRDQGQIEERLRACCMAEIEPTKRERWLWTKIGKMGWDISKLRRAMAHMMRLLMEEHNFLSAGNLRWCMQAACTAGDTRLVQRLGRIQDRLKSGQRKGRRGKTGTTIKPKGPK